MGFQECLGIVKERCRTVNVYFALHTEVIRNEKQITKV